MPKAKICLIYTGGTIGMRRLSDGTLVPPDNPKDFANLAPELSRQDAPYSFDFRVLMNKDSTNMNPSDWSLIAGEIYERIRLNKYTGFVVAHGTDTMHFTASAVAFSLGKNLNVPVVFTGAQTTPEVLHGDARVNLLRAFKVAAEADIAEVVICFGDFVFRGCRAQKKDEKKFDAFESPAFPPLAFITEEIVTNFRSQERKKVPRPIEFNAEFAKGVLQFSLIPGLEPKLLSPVIRSGECNGIILQSFGAGNVPDAKDYSFVEIIKESVELHIPVLITSQFPANSAGDTEYAPGKEAIKAGAIPTGNMTASCAVAKFRWVLAKVNRMIQERTISEEQRVTFVRKLMKRKEIGEMD